MYKGVFAGKVYGYGTDSESKVGHNEEEYQASIKSNYVQREIDKNILLELGVMRMAISSYKPRFASIIFVKEI